MTSVNVTARMVLKRPVRFVIDTRLLLR